MTFNPEPGNVPGMPSGEELARFILNIRPDQLLIWAAQVEKDAETLTQLAQLARTRANNLKG